ncbi:hypothetical protein BH20ACT15_BH20ACT15_05770 [soil metagenome]
MEADAIEAISKQVTEGLDFRISTAATWVNPVTSRVFRLPLDSRSTDFEVECHDNQKIAVRVKGVILYKVGDNYPAMAATARRFLQMDEDALNQSIRDLVTGQVRALVGGMTIPEMITDRQKLIDNVREATHEDMARLGLSIDSLSIQDLSDDHEYIRDLGRPQAEAVAREASIAADEARRERERAKQAADLEIAKVRRDTEVEAASYSAEEDRARQEASQAGPLAKATAEREVVARQAEIAAEIARPLGAIDRMVVLDGPEGLTKSLVGAVAQAGDALAEIKGMVADNPHEGPEPSGGGGGPDDGDGDGGSGPDSAPPPPSSGQAAPPLGDLMEDADQAPPPQAPEEPEAEAEPEPQAEAAEAGALDFLKQRFEALDAEEAPDYGALLAETETDDKLAAAMGEVARDPEAVQKLLARSRLSERSQQVVEDLLSRFTGSRD